MFANSCTFFLISSMRDAITVLIAKKFSTLLNCLWP
jgi:hypothetical protein